MLRRVHDHLLALDRWVEIRDDANLPRVAEPQRLGRSPILTSHAEGAALQLVFDRLSGSWSAGPRGRDRHEPSRDRVAPQVCRQLPPPPWNGFSSSIGSGMIRLVVRSELISSIVCRKRNCNDIGFSLSTAAASFSRSEAWNSPSAAITLARRSRSASA